MKKKLFFRSALMASLFVTGAVVTSCSNEADVEDGSQFQAKAALATVTVGGLYTSDYHMTAGNEYILDGKMVFANGAKLTIDAGVTIKGVFKTDPTKASAIVITKGSQIIANGTATNPIIMTAQNGTKGGWGGLVMLGKATVNQGNTKVIEGIDNSIATDFPGVDFTYGGSDDADNSGSLKYVRIEFAGASIAANNELNAFTFGGVGSGTTLENLQAYKGADDAFEFFGGTVNAKYLISTATDDDAFDFDFGYRGKLQFLISNIDKTLSYSSDPNGIECDNDGAGSGATPFTHPVISNLTVIGADGAIAGGGPLKSGANFRRNTQFTLVNSILYGFPTGILHQTSNSYTFERNVVNGTTTIFSGFTPSSTNTGVSGNPVTAATIMLTTPFVNPYNATSVRPTGTNTSGAGFAGMDPFFTVVAYKGAVAPSGVKWNAASWVRN